MFRFEDAVVQSNQAEIILDGTNAAIEDINGADALATLALNDTGAALRLLNGRDFSTAADLVNDGTIELGGGTFNANSIDNMNTIDGFGTIAVRPT